MPHPDAPSLVLPPPPAAGRVRVAFSGGLDSTVLLHRLARSYPQLTDRERQIVALTLLGDSAAEIGQLLSIKPATVLTYRQRAYERYRFGRASDFLAGLLH